MFLVAIAVVGAAAAAVLSGSRPPSITISLSLDSISGVFVGAAAVVIATRLMFFTEKGVSWESLCLDANAASPSRIGLGLLVGALAIGAPSALLLLSRELDIRLAPAGNWYAAAGFDIIFFALAATMEELVIRGYVFSLLRRRWGWKAALIATSVAFGALHLGNPGVSAESILNVTLAGFLLGAILLVTRSLYAAIAAHFAWNWTMSALFHSAVSGATIPAPNYAIVDNGPDWLTGGQWGPEGGAAATAGMIVMIFYLYRLRKNRVES